MAKVFMGENCDHCDLVTKPKRIDIYLCHELQPERIKLNESKQCLITATAVSLVLLKSKRQWYECDNKNFPLFTCLTGKNSKAAAFLVALAGVFGLDLDALAADYVIPDVPLKHQHRQ